MSYELIDEDKGLLFRFSGDVTFDELTLANQEGWEHPDWDKHQYQIWDYMNASTLTGSELQFKMMSSMDKVHSQQTQPMKFALISDNQQIITVLESYTTVSQNEKMESRLFSDEETAREWISQSLK